MLKDHYYSNHLMLIHIHYYDNFDMLYQYLDDRYVLNMKQLVDIQDIHYLMKLQYERQMNHLHMDHHVVLFQYKMLEMELWIRQNLTENNRMKWKHEMLIWND